MTQFANTPGIPKEDADKLFAAGVSFLSNKAFSSAYVCFDRLPVKDFRLLYNKALCCFMVGWYDECHRLLCEAERLVPMNADHGTERLPEAFLRYLHDEESRRGLRNIWHTSGFCDSRRKPLSNCTYTVKSRPFPTGWAGNTSILKH